MGRKNIKLPEPLFNALRDDKGDTQSWPHYLETECLHDGTDLETVLDRLDGLDADGEGMSYDDVKAACRAAIREELPTERL